MQTVPPPTPALRVLSAWFDRANDLRQRQNLDTFRRCLGAEVDIIECGFPGATALPESARRIEADPLTNCVWQKERLLNIGLKQLPASTEYVAWIDADVILPPDWQAKAERALRTAAVVQLFSSAHWMGPDWKVQKTFHSCARLWPRGIRSVYAHPGFAWAARREALPQGLFDLHLTGGADTWMAYCFCGRTDAILRRIAVPFLRDAFSKWAKATHGAVRGRVASIRGDLIHLYHGRYADRQYNQRDKWMLEFDLQRHQIERDANGLWAVTGNEAFCRRMRDYYDFRRQSGGHRKAAAYA